MLGLFFSYSDQTELVNNSSPAITYAGPVAVRGSRPEDSHSQEEWVYQRPGEKHRHYYEIESGDEDSEDEEAAQPQAELFNQDTFYKQIKKLRLSESV